MSLIEADGHYAAPPAGHFTPTDDVWALAERDFRAGYSQTQVCARYGMSLTALKERARAGRWRRCDLAEAEPVSDDERGDDPEANEPVDCAALAEDALVQVRLALRRGRAAEAGSWMRLHEKLAARLDAARRQAEERARRLERVEQARGSAGADDPLVRALRPLKDRMTFLNSLGAAQLRVSRAWRRDQISRECFVRFNELHTAAVDTLDAVLAAEADRLGAPISATDPTDPAGPAADFSPAPDP